MAAVKADRHTDASGKWFGKNLEQVVIDDRSVRGVIHRDEATVVLLFRVLLRLDTAAMTTVVEIQDVTCFGVRNEPPEVLLHVGDGWSIAHVGESGVIDKNSGFVNRKGNLFHRSERLVNIVHTTRQFSSLTSVVDPNEKRTDVATVVRIGHFIGLEGVDTFCLGFSDRLIGADSLRSVCNVNTRGVPSHVSHLDALSIVVCGYKKKKKNVGKK
ncbi:hypothetical protein AGDE_16735 [Angomonas deanei]|nr:hypothetical protein AGDE_16735 [Angomonas deanei]|eukprot:EPY16311.1 hypothetical protein AGDE_16735 [Angomonas deanei]